MFKLDLKKKLIFILLLISQTCLIYADDLINESEKKEITINPLSVVSLKLEKVYKNEIISFATGFIVERDNKYYLITNWHVVSGRHPSTYEIFDKQGRIPEELNIWYNGKKLGSWIRKSEKLYENNGKHRWLEHPYGSDIDVVALPIKVSSTDITIYSIDLNLSKTDMIPEVAMPISIIGFPSFISNVMPDNKFPIWKTGYIASEPEVDFNDEPVFLIDTTPRKGMSGSPVVLRLSGGYKTRTGRTMMVSSGYKTLFLGIYSGYWSLPEVGKVWKPSVLDDIFENQ